MTELEPNYKLKYIGFIRQKAGLPEKTVTLFVKTEDFNVCRGQTKKKYFHQCASIMVYNKNICLVNSFTV